jgi:hypothetical protein
VQPDDHLGVVAGGEARGGRVLGEQGRRRAAQEVVERHTAIMPKAIGCSIARAAQEMVQTQQERIDEIVPCIDSAVRSCRVTFCLI